MHKLKITLSERLNSLRHFWNGEQHIWDIGCDHGDLGLSFIDESIKEIHLVDPSRPVFDSLKEKVRVLDSYITKPKVFITHSEGQKLTISSFNNLIFIAGMGGKEILEIILHLLPQLDSESSLVISPHRKILELRNALGKMPLALKKEMAIFENEQFYPVLHLKKGEGEKVSPYGKELWKGKTGEAYRLHQLSAFSRHQDPLSRGYFEYLTSLNV